MLKEYRLLHDTLIESVNMHPGKIAVEANGETYTYTDLYEKSIILASYLIMNGLKRGDRVGIYMDNTWECVVSIYAVLLSGGVFFVINPQTKIDKLEYMLNDCNATFLISDSHLKVVYDKIINNVESLKGLVYSGKKDDADLEGIERIHFDDLPCVSSDSFSAAFVIPTDLAALIYTSGSTGNPKGVMMRHSNMVFASGSLIQYIRMTEEERVLCAIPLAFDYGLYQLIMSIRLGATLILERSFTYPAQIVNRIKDSEATVFPAVPTIWATLIGMHSRKPIVFEKIEKITNTAAALPADYIPTLREIFPNALIFKMYGLTECKRVSYLEPEDIDKKINSVGKPIPGTEMFILKEDGKKAEPGEVGILHVRGPHVMAGYWNKPELSEQMLKDGEIPGEKILCAQDWFLQDEDGYFYFKGRSDDIIKTRGEKVSPVEVENALHSIDGVKKAAVIGVDDDILGLAIKAFIVLDEGKEMTEREVIKFCLSRLENFMVPKYVEFREDLPMTNTGKISKKGLN